MPRRTISTLAGLMALGAIGACAQTTTPPAETTSASTTDQTAPPSASTETTSPAQATEPTTTAPTTDQMGATQPQATPTAGNPVPATQADIAVGATVNDTNGVMIGTVESVDATGVVLKTGDQRVKLPITSFGKNSSGLMIGTTKADFDAKIAASKGAQPSANPGTDSQPNMPPPTDRNASPPPDTPDGSSKSPQQ